MGGQAEGEGSHRAAVGFFAGVGALVADQIAGSLKAAVAGVAAVRLLDRVCA